VQQHGDFGDDIGSCSGAAVLVGYGLFEFGMACSENKAACVNRVHYLSDY